MLRPVLVLLLLAGCHAEAPTSFGFTGTCKLDVRSERTDYIKRLLTLDELKTHVALELSQGMLVSMHVEIPDSRTTTTDQEPDNPVVSGDTRPNVPLDPETDVDVPIELSRQDAPSPLALQVRLRFHGRTADGVVGRMHVTGECVPATPETE